MLFRQYLKKIIFLRLTVIAALPLSIPTLQPCHLLTFQLITLMSWSVPFPHASIFVRLLTVRCVSLLLFMPFSFVRFIQICLASFVHFRHLCTKNHNQWCPQKEHYPLKNLVCVLPLLNSFLLVLLSLCHSSSFPSWIFITFDLFLNCSSEIATKDQFNIFLLFSCSTSLENWNNAIHSLLYQLHALHGGFRPLTFPLILLRAEFVCGHVLNGIQLIPLPKWGTSKIHPQHAARFVNPNYQDHFSVL